MQVAVLNAASFFGRNLLNLAADHYGQFNITCPVSVISAGLSFAMFGATTTGGVIAFAILYGFFSGGCESVSCILVIARLFIDVSPTVASLLPATLAVFSRDLSEVGCVPYLLHL